MGLSQPLGWARAIDWWQWKLPPLLGVAYLDLLVLETAPDDAWPALAALGVSASALAAYAHVINDVFDIESDREAGVPNRAAALSPTQRAALIAGLGLAGLLPWTVVGPGPWAAGALGVIVALPWLYSAPPLRWKARGGLGVVADAVLAHVAPALFASALVIDRSAGTDPATPTGALSATVGLWSLGLGLRGIVIHQLLAAEGDRRSGVATYAVRRGPDRARRLATAVAFPMELAGLAGMVGMLLARRRSVGATVVAVATGVGLRHLALRLPLDPAPLEPFPAPTLVRQYTTWPPLLLAGGLAWRRPVFWPLVAVHGALFGGPALRQLRSAFHEARLRLRPRRG